jgi:hypothetical protein
MKLKKYERKTEERKKENNMSDFDYDKIKDMEYDPDRGRYVGKDGSEFKVTPFSDGSGYKYDYYDKSTYDNAEHNSTHVKSDLNENWERTDNNRDSGTQDKSSGSGCYLTTACMKNRQSDFEDSCIELMTLRWFRDNFVSKDEINHYYQIAPIIVDSINSLKDNNKIYNWIYENVVVTCVEAIKNGDYDFAYNRYKNSVLTLEEKFARPELEKRFVKSLKLKRKANNC